MDTAISARRLGAVEKMKVQTNSRENQEEEGIQSQEESDRISPKA
jgi:hypothetical protein